MPRGYPQTMSDRLGNQNLAVFDVVVVGSGAGGSTVAKVLAEAGKRVLVLEAGNNRFPGLDRPGALGETLLANDELKLDHRGFIHVDELVDPAVFRSEPGGVRRHIGAVNPLPRTVGGGAVHALMGYPRFGPLDFRLGSALGDVPGASFVDWPVDYDALEPYYSAVERWVGVQGEPGADPYAGQRSAPFPMPPGLAMYGPSRIASAARKLGYQPFPFPRAINSRPYDGRPACVMCGHCNAGCPTHAKGSPAVTLLRRALLTGNCQLRYNTHALRLRTNGSETEVIGVEVLTPEGEVEVVTASEYVLAAGALANIRLLMLSGQSTVGNRSGQVGRNLTFHVLTLGIGIFRERMHMHRGNGSSFGMTDFRGRPKDDAAPLGGIVDFVGADKPIVEAKTYATMPLLGARGEEFARLMRESPLRDHLMALEMIHEDAPQPENRVDLDPEIQTALGIPAIRVTYRPHAFEQKARAVYGPKMMALLKAAGAQFGFLAPAEEISTSAHHMGTLRMGDDPRTSVCDRRGRFHDVGNLLCADGSLFPTSAGYNPTLTIQALAAWVAGHIVAPDHPAQILRS